jgi:nitroimidazol reductase NimA-like FMN-containing flavoprotein (pyridoxamine 5'-phosphate oxidase superfamily)
VVDSAVSKSTRRLDPAERDELLAAPLIAVFATEYASGGIHAVPVWFLFHEGRLEILTDKDSVKAQNVARTNQATICIQKYSDGDVRYVTALGHARLEVASREKRRHIWAKYKGPEAAARLNDVDMSPTCLIVLTPERWTAWLD